MTRSWWLITPWLLAFGCSAPVVELEAEPQDGQVQLDESAREAGWELRVTGFCLPLDGETAIEVSTEERAVLGRWDGEAYDFQFLYPPSGALLWVHGAEASLDVIEGTPIDDAEVEGTPSDEAEVEGTPSDEAEVDEWEALTGTGQGRD